MLNDESKLMAADARAIANLLLDMAESKGLSLSITSLLKIVYFAHGWHLARFGSPLVGQPFEAWEHGPVVRVIYDAFKGESGRKIEGRAKVFSAANARYEVATCSVDVDTSKFLESILESYAQFHPYSLSEMTHEVGSPWRQVWERASKEAVPGMRIPDTAIREYFLRQNESDIFKI